MATAAVWPALSGCHALAPMEKVSGQVVGPETAGIEPPRRPGTPLVLIAMPALAPFQDTRRSLVAELGRSYDVSTFIVTAETTADLFRARLDAAAKDGLACLVLMNNTTVNLYRDYQRSRAGAIFPPAVIVMTSFLEDRRAGLLNATGIAYEVPGVTAFVNLRAIVKAPISRVGVVHARYSSGFIERQKALAAKEQIVIVPVEVSDQPTLREMKSAFRALKEVSRVDALWVLNDNRLLKDGRFLMDVWKPQIEWLGVPVIVSAGPLVNPQASFGTFGVLPDHGALGVQAANLILDLADDGWNAAAHPIDLPLATINVLDLPLARDRFGLREGGLNRVDRTVE
jgi:hypothetical protein